MTTGPPRPQALLEVCLCSGPPTQIAVQGLLRLADVHPAPDGRMTLSLLAYVTSLDTILLIGLVFALLVLGGESPRAVLLGTRPIAREVLRGLGLVPWVLLIVAAAGLTIRRWAPDLIAPNPLATLASTPAEFVLFALCAVVGGGLREEVQRAFVVHRCEQRLGGAVVGVVGFGLLFGALHLLQGWSAVIITALLGMLWSVVYLVRRSIVAPMVSHAAFNLIHVIGFGLLR